LYNVRCVRVSPTAVIKTGQDRTGAKKCEIRTDWTPTPTPASALVLVLVFAPCDLSPCSGSSSSSSSSSSTELNYTPHTRCFQFTYSLTHSQLPGSNSEYTSK
jgi:hypothetical protein